MAPDGRATASAKANGRPSMSGESTGVSESPLQTSTPAAESLPDDQPPPAKKPRLKLNVRAKKDGQNENSGDTITVMRPKRDVKPRKYGNTVEQPRPAPVISRQSQPSPAPSSDLSSLSSAPPSPLSERAESPFVDPEPAGEEEYGSGFMSYYVDTGGLDPKPKATKATSTTKRKEKAQSAQKAPATTHVQAEKPVEPPRGHAPQPVQSRAPQYPVQQQHTHQHSLPIASQGHVPPQPSQAPQQVGMPYPRPPPVAQRPPPPQRPVPMPQPVINFIDIVHDPKPMRPDTVRDMVKKLEALSSALTDFGGVPAMPNTPPSEHPPSLATAPKPTKAHKPAETGTGPKVPAADAVGNFLSMFDDGDDEEEDDEPIDPLDRPLLKPGVVDGPLSFGIQFIQNALRSWAQQRINHQVTQQFQAQHQQQMHQQIQPAKRGPGRPRRYDEIQQQALGPIIHFDMSGTPEGMAIKSFQSVLDSGCLLVNGILPVELSRALRRLYMQIDHLINQGVKDNTSWQCMSYGAQINAQKTRVEQWKQAAAKAEDELERKRDMVLGPPTAETQAQQAHATNLERRRSAQHATQQPYNAQQHSQAMQMASQPPGTPLGIVSSRSPSAARQSVQPTGAAGISSTVSNTPGVVSGLHGQQRPVSGSIKGDAGSPIEIDADITADHSNVPQAAVPAVQPTRPVTGGFTAVNAPPPLPQVRAGSVTAEVHDTPSPETIKVAHTVTHATGYASGSASPALHQGNGLPGQGVMSGNNFPHPGAVVIDQ